MKKIRLPFFLSLSTWPEPEVNGVYLDSVISKATDDFVVIVLQAVHPLARLTAAVDALQSMASCPPVVFYPLERKQIDGLQLVISCYCGLFSCLSKEHAK